MREDQTTPEFLAARPSRSRRCLQAAALRVAERALQAESMEELSRHAAEVLAQALHAVSAYVLDAADGTVVVSAGSGWAAGAPDPGAGPRGLTAYLLRARGPLFASNLVADARFEPPLPLLSRGVHAAIAAPSRCGDRVVGAVVVGLPVQRRLSRDERELVGTVARVLGCARARALSQDARAAAISAAVHAQSGFRRVLDALPDAVAVVRHGKVVYVNHAACALLGYAAEPTLAGRDCLELVPAEERPLAHDALQALQQGARLPVREMQYLRADGEAVWCEVSAARLPDFEGEPAICVLARDVSERRRLRDQLLVADRMASIGLLAAGVAHEINNPLAIIAANLSLAAESVAAGAPKPAELAAQLADAGDGAARIREIVREIRLFARPENAELVDLDLRQVLRGALRFSHNELRHRAKVVEQLDHAAVVRANEARLSQVFVNLLVNAAQAITEGGSEDNTITVTTAKGPGDTVVIEIADTGRGIAPEHQEHLFTPFFTTKPVGEGMGLGLSICHRIVSDLGGEIRFEPRAPRGTVARVTLPEVAVPRPARVKVASQPLPTRRLRVLVVDDEPVVGRSLSRVLGAQCEVEVLSDAPAALERLRADPRFDVILCDLMMPRMTGMDFYGALRAQAPALADRVIFLTGGAFSASARAFLDQVKNPCVEKPFDVTELRDLVLQRCGPPPHPSASAA